jgi:hypothetical protein
MLCLDSDLSSSTTGSTLGRREVVPTTVLGDDDLGEYEFQAARAEDGRLACVYQTTWAADDSYYFLIFNAGASES